MESARLRPGVADASARDRLIEAARGLFAASGYEQTSVRDIVSRAGTNLNSINYYFGGKRQLYAAVLTSERQRADAQRSAPATHGTGGAPQQLRALVRRLVFVFLDAQSLLPRLAALEIVNPSPAFADVVPRLHEREQAELTDVIGRLLGDDARPELIRRCVRSVLSQCSYYMFMGPALARLEPAARFDELAITALADHITEFSLGAIRHLRARI
jgi:AcrR family transcriptional regulator